MSDIKDFEIVDSVLVKYHGNGGSVVVPDGVKRVGFSAFEECKTLTSITIPDSVTVIDSEAFRDCKNFVVNTYKGSYAEKYAVEHGISVVYTRDKMKVMWYKNLVENEAAEYFMNNDICTDDEAEKEISMQMLQMYKRIVRDVTFSISVETRHMIWNSIWSQSNARTYDLDTELLSAEQCALLIMYPFWSRMDGSFEEHFYNSGRLKKYLCALKNKCDTK